MQKQGVKRHLKRQANLALEYRMKQGKGMSFAKVLLVFIELFSFSFLSVTGQGIDLVYHDIEWIALETNRDHSVIFELTSKYCILDSC